MEWKIGLFSVLRASLKPKKWCTTIKVLPDQKIERELERVEGESSCLAGRVCLGRSTNPVVCNFRVLALPGLVLEHSSVPLCSSGNQVLCWCSQEEAELFKEQVGHRLSQRKAKLHCQEQRY